jgi:methylated-DNA-[protein]-cysteine S-methyltransferase
MNVSHYVYYQSPIGLIEIGGDVEHILSLYFVDEPRPDVVYPPDATSHDALAKALRQVDEYFGGVRRAFDLNFAFSGTAFQEQVWRQLLTVPYGQVATYRDIAHAIGRPKAVRAVGAANGQNPISIIVPCHRIIGSNGKLTGYGGGLWRKEWLLRHEGYLVGCSLSRRSAVARCSLSAL